MRIAYETAAGRNATAGQTKVLADSLTGYFRARIQQPRHHGGIEVGGKVIQNIGAELHWHAGNKNTVFDGDAFAKQRALIGARQFGDGGPGTELVFGPVRHSKAAFWITNRR